MQPADLTAQSFAGYPPHARAMAVDNLPVLRTLPLNLLASMLREIIVLDWRFPAERRTIEAQCRYLGSLSGSARAELLHAFAAIAMPAELMQRDWVNQPQQFLEEMTAHLWASHQMDAFQAAARSYAGAVRAGAPDSAPVIPRLAFAILDADLQRPGYPLFRKLRPHGVYYPQVATGNAGVLLAHLQQRAAAHPEPYAHWLIDGSSDIEGAAGGVSCVSWASSSGMRRQILDQMHAIIGSGSGGPELLRTRMAEWAPSFPSDSVLQRFTRTVYAEGSGTQIFSTVFAEWSAREALRRAQPLTLGVQFGPRQRQQPMNVMLTAAGNQEQQDPAGSLVDADMSAYYTWINLTRLNGTEQSRFLAWSAAHGQAVVIAPGLTRGTESARAMSLGQLLELAIKA